MSISDVWKKLAQLILLICFSAIAEKQPNIVVILADDLGYGSLSCYGGPIPTPNIDRLAEQGMRFTDAHTPGSVCTPTRYALLTGEYAWRSALKTGVVDYRSPLIIDPKNLSLPEMLQRKGYVTGCVGKWHLGFQDREPVWSEELKPGPWEVGFDSFFGFATNPSAAPRVYIRGHDIVGADPADPMRSASSGAEKAHALFSYEAMAAQLLYEASDFVRKNRERPFFLYYALNNVHHPIRPNLRFRGTSAFGLYGDFIVEMDWIVGQFSALLDELGLSDDTLLIFTSDNGAYDGGQKTAPKGKLGNVYVSGGGYGAIDSVPAAKELGFSPNGICRDVKGSLFEGGSRVPFIVRWPGETPAGTVNDELLCLTDLMATFAGLTGCPLEPQDAPDSVNAFSLFQSPDALSKRDVQIIGDSKGGLAVRKGEWKYVTAIRAVDFQRDRTRKEYLFNLADDPGEQNNLLPSNPEKVAELDALLMKTMQQGSIKGL